MPTDFANTPPGTGPLTQPSLVNDRTSPEDRVSFTELKEKVSEDISSASDAIKSGAEAATAKVKDAVSDQATYAAKQVGGIAAALQKVGTELKGSEQASVGKYATQIGQSVEGFAKRMEGKDIGEIANMAEEFGRKQPLAFLGIAALAGLSASRFLTASAKRAPSASGSSTASNVNSDMTGERGNG